MLRQRVHGHVDTLRGKQPRRRPGRGGADCRAGNRNLLLSRLRSRRAGNRPLRPPCFRPFPTYDPEARADLPIPGYDALSASQVVERLAGLPSSELDAVYAYEAAHRQRRTILGKIEQLAV